MGFDLANFTTPFLHLRDEWADVIKLKEMAGE